jgi:hypothetical protein
MRMKHLVTALAAVIAGCAAGTTTTFPDGGGSGGPATVVGLAVTPPTPIIAAGTGEQFTATAVYSDGTTRDMSAQATWTSDPAAVATITNAGKASAVAPGTATIKAAYMGFEATASLTVTAAALSSLAVSPDGQTVAIGTTSQMTAVGTFADKSMQDVTAEVAWSSDDDSIVTVNGSGLVTAVAAGTAKVTAILQGKSADATFTVSAATLKSIAVAPGSATLAKGTTQAFTATATFSDGKSQSVTSQVAWTVDPAGIASINAQGVATGLAGGSAAVHATFMGKSDSATLTVTEARLTSIALTPANATVVRGSSLQFTATGTFTMGPNQDLTSQVAWASDATAVATVSNAAGTRGLATGITTGSASIGVLFQSVAATTTLTVIGQAPILTSLSPTEGPELGGTTVSLTGTGFTGATAVRFGTTSARFFTVVSDTSITAVTSVGMGNASVVVTTAYGMSNALYFAFMASPTISAVSPASGPQAGGTLVTITGKGFTGATDVSFGNAASSSFMVLSDSQLTAISPAGVGAVNVKVTGPNGTSLGVPFAYGAAPTIGGITPHSGGEAGGTMVAITGTGLGDTSAVSFGSAPATTFTVVSGTQIVAVSPPGTGAVNVSVTTGNGHSNGSPFTYRSAPTASSVDPNAGPQNGGNTVIIRGAGFDGATAVTFGGTAATSFVVVSDSMITAVTPGGHGPVTVIVTTPIGTSGGLDYTFGPPPTLTSLEPNAGPYTGGRTISLEGTNFSSATAVYFGPQSASFTIISDTVISVVTPALFLHRPVGSTVDVKVVSIFGESNTLLFTYGPAPAITMVAPPGVATTGGTPVIVTGTSLSFVITASVNGVSIPAIVLTGNTVAFIAPAGTGTVPVTLTSPYGTSNTLTLTYVGPPVITSFTPTTGFLPGGATVVLTGTNFSDATSVFFGATPATSFTVDSATQITAVTPALVEDGYQVEVVTPYGMGDSVGLYTVTGPPSWSSRSPGVGPVGGGTLVSLIGSNFVGTTTVVWSSPGALATTLSAVVTDAAHLTFLTPLSAMTGSATFFVVTGSGPSNTGAFVYGSAPAISLLSPSSGPEGGGTTVDITGTSFDVVTAVKFGGVDATSFTQDLVGVHAVAPAGTGTASVTVISQFGTSNGLTYSYTPIVIPTVSSITPASGTAPTGGTSVSIVGSGFTGATDVTIGGVSALFMFVSDTTITATTPPHPAAIVDVSVTNAAGTGTLTNGFNYVGLPMCLGPGSPCAASNQCCNAICMIFCL